MSYGRAKGVIFDLGSTLIEYENRPWEETTRKGISRGYRSLVEDGVKVPDLETFADGLMAIMDELRQRAIETMTERQSTDAPKRYFSELGLGDAARLSKEFMDVFFTAVTDTMVMVPGANETLARLKEDGLPIGLISNTMFRPDQHDAGLREYGLMDYLDFRIYSSTVGVRKPHPDIFRAGIAQMNLPAEEIVYVGDSYHWDVKGAQGVGMLPILKYRPGRLYPDPLPTGFPVIHSLAELPGILRG